jgi:hypothetical protein
MKKSSKMLNISVQFNDTEEACKQIESVLRKLRSSQTNYGRKLTNGCVLEWGVSSMEEPKSYRVEVVNGQKCFIIPSKMNEK